MATATLSGCGIEAQFTFFRRTRHSKPVSGWQIMKPCPGFLDSDAMPAPAARAPTMPAPCHGIPTAEVWSCESCAASAARHVAPVAPLALGIVTRRMRRARRCSISTQAANDGTVSLQCRYSAVENRTARCLHRQSKQGRHVHEPLECHWKREQA